MTHHQLGLLKILSDWVYLIYISYIAEQIDKAIHIQNL